MKLKLIGGEADFKKEGIYSYITDSGRSSIRLILQGGFKDMKFLLPDFLCKVIPEVFDELHVRYSYYKVNSDLSIDIESLKEKGAEFDAIYLINYFGQKNNYGGMFSDMWVIEDSVFLPVVEPPADVKKWIGFNSFRKVSYLADGSIIKSTTKLSDEQIHRSEPEFQRLKYEAKRIKYEYLHDNLHSEESYLSLFKEAEEVIDKQREIYSISNLSLFNLFDFYKNIDREYSVRRRNYNTVDKHLNNMAINLTAEYYTLYVLSVDKRDELRNYLFSRQIYLPVHWPRIAGVDNDLYDRIISIPVDSRYDEKDMMRVVESIESFYRSGH